MKNIDHHLNIGRRIFAAAAPLLDDLGQSEYVQHGMDAIRTYDNVRGQVMDIDEKARTHGARIGSADFFS